MIDTGNPLALPETFQEMLCVFETFRKLGFPAEDIYFGSSMDIERPKLGPCMWVSLKRDGKVVYRINCGEIPKGVGVIEARDAWLEVCENLKKPEVYRQEDLDIMYAKSMIFQKRDEFLASLSRKGIAIPNLHN